MSSNTGAPILILESGRLSRLSIRIRTTVSCAKPSLKTCRDISSAGSAWRCRSRADWTRGRLWPGIKGQRAHCRATRLEEFIVTAGTLLVARQVARACGQPHQVIQVGADFFSRFPQLAERTVYLTDGCADVSCSPPFYVMPAGARHRPRKNDRQLRRPNPSPIPGIQAQLCPLPRYSSRNCWRT